LTILADCVIIIHGKISQGAGVIKLKILKCKRCGYEWVPRRGHEDVRQCSNPKCRSVYWDKERTETRGRK